MKYAAAAAVLAGSAAATTVGNGVPLIYASKPFPDSIYGGQQFNQTIINGVAYNASNEWPCLNAAGYESIIPTCAVPGIKKALSGDDCDVDDFSCHCTAEASAKLDAIIVPILEAADGPCTGPEIGQLANFVHGALCPYFIDVPADVAYGNCKKAQSSSAPAPPKSSSKAAPAPSSSKAAPKPSSSAKAGDNYWPEASSSAKKATTSSKAGYWPDPPKASSSQPGWKPCTTSTTTVQSTWSTWCPEPTTFWVGSKTWTVTEATTLTVWDCPITSTKEVVYWTPVSWATSTSPAAPVYYSSAASWAAGYTAAPVTTSAGGWAAPTAAYTAKPVQFTGAASNNKIAAGVAGVAAAAALLI